jgi:hypothetical protein
MALAFLLNTAYDGVIVWAVVGASVITYLGIAMAGLMRRAK